MKYKSGETPSGPLCDFCGGPVGDPDEVPKATIECTQLGWEGYMAEEVDCCYRCWIGRVVPALEKLLKPGHSFNRYKTDGSDFLDGVYLDPTDDNGLKGQR